MLTACGETLRTGHESVCKAAKSVHAADKCRQKFVYRVELGDDYRVLLAQ